MPARVVFALQSPTLLSHLAASRLWSIEVADFGDATFAERSLLALRTWDGRRHGVLAVFICSTQHAEAARTVLPGVPLVWVCHSERNTARCPASVDCALTVTFTHQAAIEQSKQHPGHAYTTIIPAYKARLAWTWRKGFAWTLRSRPQHRDPQDFAAVMDAVHGCDGLADFQLYGEDQPRGFASPVVKAALTSACSAYVSCLPRLAGFGLAEHECLAAGVPVVGSRWGDMGQEMADSYLPLSADGLQRQAMLSALCTNRAFGEQISAMGLDFIAEQRSIDRMDAGITRLLDLLHDDEAHVASRPTMAVTVQHECATSPTLEYQEGTLTQNIDNPREHRVALNADHHKRMARAAASSPTSRTTIAGDLASRQEIVAAMLGCRGRFRLGPLRGGEILELGAGYAGDRDYLTEQLEAGYAGVELVPEVAAMSRDVTCLALEELPAAWRGRFRWVYSRHVMEHVLDIDEAIAAIVGVLSPDGVVGAVTPHYFPDPEPAHVCQRTIEQWMSAYRRHGLVPVYATTPHHACAEAQLVLVRRSALSGFLSILSATDPDVAPITQLLAIEL